MVKKIAKFLAKILEVTNRLSDIISYILTGYEKVEEKKAEYDEKVFKYARYIILGVVTGGVAIILFLIIKKIVKRCKERRAEKIKKHLEKQLALEV